MPYKDPETRNARLREKRATDPRWRERLIARHGVVWAKADKEEKLVSLAGRPRPEECEVCGRSHGGRSKVHGTVWDHDHKTGLFRGWICSKCNTILGQSDDNPTILRDLADYLERNGPKFSLGSN